MTERQITIGGRAWKVSIAGRFTVYERDEFPLMFEHRGDDGQVERRFCRFSPLGARSRDRALEELSDADLARLWTQSQDAWTSPEAGYVRR